MVTQKTLSGVISEKLVLKGLPLAVYREVAAHLRQVATVEVALETRRSPEEAFDYHQSQIGAMVIKYPENLSEQAHGQINQILGFYGDRHGQWQRNIIHDTH